MNRLVCAPGNPGMAALAEQARIDPADPRAVTELATSTAADLVIVGSEAPLASGVTDALRAENIAVFGPSAAAARLETSKSFAKAVMRDAGVPTASAMSFTQPDPANQYLSSVGSPYVVKADGLAAGKGVLVTESLEEARAWVNGCFGGRFGAAGSRVVIEDYLDGPEVSVFGLAAGTKVIPLRPARDYKRLRDGDRGPNTGGMGAYSPVPDLGDSFVDAAVADLIVPVLTRLADLGHPYVGFIYAGLIRTPSGPKVLEFNCRLGDPETQALLPLLRSDLLATITACLEGADDVTVDWSDEAAVNVVLASKGYPEAPAVGDEIHIPEAGSDDSLIFHAGTRVDDRGVLRTAGGRVLSIVGLGADLETARRRAYDRATTVEFAGSQYRKDIGL